MEELQQSANNKKQSISSQDIKQGNYSISLSKDIKQSTELFPTSTFT